MECPWAAGWGGVGGVAGNLWGGSATGCKSSAPDHTVSVSEARLKNAGNCE